MRARARIRVVERFTDRADVCCCCGGASRMSVQIIECGHAHFINGVASDGLSPIQVCTLACAAEVARDIIGRDVDVINV